MQAPWGRVTVPVPRLGIMAMPAAVSAGFAILATLVALEIVQVGLHPFAALPQVDRFLDIWPYAAIINLAALLIVARAALVKTDRSIWILMAAAFVIWAAADTIYSTWVWFGPEPSSPSLLDVGWMAPYPLIAAGLGLLAVRRVGRFTGKLLLSGAIAALAVAALGAATLLQGVLPTIADGNLAEAAYIVSYPVLDIMLLALAAGILAMAGRRITAPWALMMAGIVAWSVGDGAFNFMSADGSWADGTPWDLTWVAGDSLIAVAAWTAPRSSRAAEPEAGRTAGLLGLFAMVGLGVLVAGFLIGANPVAEGLAAATIAIAVFQLVRTLAENRALDARAKQAAADRAAAEASLQAKSQLMATMSHEFRTPLTSIIGYTDLLLLGKGGATTAPQKAMLTTVGDVSRHLLGVVGDAVDMSALESGRLSFNPNVIDVRAAASQSVEAIRGLDAANDLRVVGTVDPDLRWIVADELRLRQVIYNYLSNAVKYTPASGAVELSITALGRDHIRVSVTDTGPGLTPKDQARLFEMFAQLDVSVTHRHSGSGLGLSLVKRIVEAQGGTVGVESEPGAGSTFWAVLPAERR